MPKVSVLIPLYNAENCLDNCLKSVATQSLDDIEIIIVVNGSLDSPEDVIKRYSDDKRIKIINKKNSGYGESLNIGLKEASGEYISIIEPKDFIDKDMLKNLYSKKGYDVIKCGFNFYPLNEIYKLNFSGCTTVEDNPQIINIKPSIWSAIYRREFLLKNNIRFCETKGISYQDISFHFKTLYLAESIYFIDEPMYCCRTSDKISEAKAKNKVQAIINEFREIYDFLSGKNSLPEVLAQLILFELGEYIQKYKRISKMYENEFIQISKKELLSKNTDVFYKSVYIKLKDKIKLYLYQNHSEILMFILSIIKKYVK